MNKEEINRCAKVDNNLAIKLCPTIDSVVLGPKSGGELVCSTEWMNCVS